MTAVPAGPGPDELVTDDAVDLAVAARRAALVAILRGEAPAGGKPGDLARWEMRQVLEAAACSIVAAWQRAEEAREAFAESDHLPSGEPEVRTVTIDRSSTLALNADYGGVKRGG